MSVNHRRVGVHGCGLVRSSFGALAIALALAGCSEDAATPAATGTQMPPVASPGAAGAMVTPSAGAQAPMSATAGKPSMMNAAGAGGGQAPMAPSAPAPSAGSGPAAGAMAMGGAGGMAAPMGMAGSGGAEPPGLPVEMGTPTIYWLDIAANLVTTAAADGSGAKRFASGSPLSAPDGVTVDPAGGHVFVLNMGSLFGGARNGSLVRYKLDGSSPEVIMRPGSMADGQTFDTGKQITIDKVNRKLYMGDREGSKVWRVDFDGSNLEVLVSGHGIQQIVGVAADPIEKKFYFSDRNGKKIYRANMEMPAGQTHADRDDLELLYVDQARNAMPLDLELDLEERVLYWTDRQQNTVFAMSMDMPAGADAMTRTDVKEVATGLLDVIGLGFDHQEKMLYVTHSGSVSRFKTDGSGLERIGSNGSTGIAFARVP